jgi:hypothetical protein
VRSGPTGELRRSIGAGWIAWSASAGAAQIEIVDVGSMTADCLGSVGQE